MGTSTNLLRGRAEGPSWRTSEAGRRPRPPSGVRLRAHLEAGKTSEVVEEVSTNLQLPKRGFPMTSNFRRRRCLSGPRTAEVSPSPREPFEDFDRPVTVGRNSTRSKVKESVPSERMPVDEFAVAPTAAVTRFLFRPREKGHWDVVEELRFPRSPRQLCAVDELRQVCRRSANKRAQVILTGWEGAFFASATDWLPRGRDCSARIDVPATPRRSKHCEVISSEKESLRLTKEGIRQSPMDVRRRGATSLSLKEC